MAKVFLNLNYKVGSNTRVILAVSPTMPADGIEWEETTEYEASNNDIELCTMYSHLYTSGDVQYFGFL